MSRPGLNAASRPFQNSRPVTRVAAALWALGGVLLLLNAALYWRAWSGQNTNQNELQEVEAKIDERRARLLTFEQRFTAMDIPLLNSRAVYLNSKLAARTFGWSRLFDRMKEVLPNAVRLAQLSPRFAVEEDDELDFVFTGDRVTLQLKGSAKNDEEVLKFIDKLFAHPSFERPSLQTESRKESGEVEWALSVFYLPKAQVPNDSGAVTAEDVDASPAAPLPAEAPTTASPGDGEAIGGVS